MKTSTPSDRQTRLLNPSVVRELSELQPRRTLFKIAQTWLEIFLAIWVCETFWHPLLYVLVVIWVGSRIFALGGLLHEAAHYRILPDKKGNDRVATYLLALPLFRNLARYRAIHLHHHAYLRTSLDPDLRRRRGENWAYPVAGTQLLKTLLLSLSGLGAIRSLYKHRDFFSGKVSSSWTDHLGKIAFYGAWVLLLTLTGSWMLFLLYWLVPIFTWLAMLFQIKDLVEHEGIPDVMSYCTPSRSTNRNWLERIFIDPLGVGFHAEHHLYPSIPFYNLPQVHQRLKEYPQLIPVYPSYWQALRGMVKGREREQTQGIQLVQNIKKEPCEN
jgi:fatty acid desaturase